MVEMSVSACTLLLVKNRVMVTKPRIAMLECIYEMPGPFSAYHLRDHMTARKFQRINLVTIYRNLGLFLQAGILRSVAHQDGGLLYEPALGDEHHSSLITCRRCKRQQLIRLASRKFIQEFRAVGQLGYFNVSYALEFSGICTQCSVEFRGPSLL